MLVIDIFILWLASIFSHFPIATLIFDASVSGRLRACSIHSYSVSYKSSERRDQILHSANEFLLFTPIFFIFIHSLKPYTHGKANSEWKKIETHIFMAVCYCIFSHEFIAADGAARSGPSDCVRATFCRRTRPSDRLRMLIAPAEISQEIARAGVANF